MCEKRFSIFFIGLLLITVFIIGDISAAAVSGKKRSGKSKVKYVSDNIAITMRSGKSAKHRVIQTLNSGAKLRLLEVGKTYSKVKTGKGKEGWVLTQYLADEPAARLQLPSAIDKIALLKTQNKDYKQQLKSVTKERNQLQTVAAKFNQLQVNHKKLSQESSKLKQAASNSSQLLAKTEELGKKTQFLQSQLDIALNENKELRDESRKQWFLIGAGVVLISMLFGSLMGRAARKSKKSTWTTGSDTLMLRQP